MRNNRVFLPGEAIALGLVDEAAVESDAWTGPAVEVDDKTAPVIAEVVRGEVRPMTVRFVSPLLARYIAPGISAFTSANIPDRPRPRVALLGGQPLPELGPSGRIRPPDG